MKLRLDLLKEMTPQDVLERAVENQHRYKAEPTFSKTGVGHLSATSTEDSVREAELNTALIQKLSKRAAKSGKSSHVGRAL